MMPISRDERMFDIFDLLSSARAGECVSWAGKRVSRPVEWISRPVEWIFRPVEWTFWAGECISRSIE